MTSSHQKRVGAVLAGCGSLAAGIEEVAAALLGMA